MAAWQDLEQNKIITPMINCTIIQISVSTHQEQAAACSLYYTVKDAVCLKSQAGALSHAIPGINSLGFVIRGLALHASCVQQEKLL